MNANSTLNPADPAASISRGRRRAFLAVRAFTAAVWIFHGLFSKLLSGIPRHERIVARVLGSDHSHVVTLVVGACEIAMGFWILSRRASKTCAAVQTTALVTMNILEIAMARDLLLSPIGMVCANAILLGAGWFLAFRDPSRR